LGIQDTIQEDFKSIAQLLQFVAQHLDEPRKKTLEDLILKGPVTIKYQSSTDWEYKIPFKVNIKSMTSSKSPRGSGISKQEGNTTKTLQKSKSAKLILKRKIKQQSENRLKSAGSFDSNHLNPIDFEHADREKVWPVRTTLDVKHTLPIKDPLIGGAPQTPPIPIKDPLIGAPQTPTIQSGSPQQFISVARIVVKGNANSSIEASNGLSSNASTEIQQLPINEINMVTATTVGPRQKHPEISRAVSPKFERSTVDKKKARSRSQIGRHKLKALNYPI